ncbi:ATPase subunit of ABC transporter with duplicated ATPase domains [Nocardiopsis arvandica]|uniref:ATPase subunit of ABC transporter with duplicated ATPase domains n=1 Tax=Nocardiopsis sinuspersici TaxID=501010 RepID=A0A7Y9X760_9ACTN|nr:ATP-binding cassette domain-containing protein [Nocardiopsis sinuspersici]NYH50467.1 ATPase subunit of ABC transporter with duplicated ATPase domains [Nocardiopsis sinuspersici]
MGYIDVNQVGHTLPDGRVLLDSVSFRVGEGSKAALVGANGAGKSTLLRIVRGEQRPQGGAVTLEGDLGVMPQFIGHVRDETTVHELLVSVSPTAVREAHADLEAAEAAMMVDDGEKTQMRYAEAIARYGDAGGYDAEVVWDQCCTEALGTPYERCRWREVRTLSGGEQKRLVIEALLRGPAPVLLLDEPDNYLDVPGKRWLEEALLATPKTVLFVSHDRELLSRVPDRIVTVELGAAGNTAWVHGGAFDTYHDARRERFARLDELRRRWDEEHSKLRALVATYKQKAAYNSDMASRYQSARTRLRRFEDAGPPEKLPREQNLRMRLRGGRTGKRALVCEGLELTGLMRPFDLEVWYGERVAVLGSNGSGKSHFLRLLAGGGSDPESSVLPEEERVKVPAVGHTGTARLGARVLPGWFAQTHEHPEFTDRTLLEILHRGEGTRGGVPRDEAGRALDRYELAPSAEQTFDTLSGGQQARFQILLLELSGATMLLLDEPTDNLDVVSAEALESALEAYEGTILAVTHDRWFARGFDRFAVFGSDGGVYEASEPVWDEGRVHRAR